MTAAPQNRLHENSVISSSRQSHRYSAFALSANRKKESAPAMSCLIIMDERRATLVWAICPRGKRSGARLTAQSFANILAESSPVTTKQQWRDRRGTG